jgi:hypothetical protein
MESGTDVVGREEEVAALVDFLDARARLPGVLLLEGEAGIGKTTLWRHGVELAAEPGYRVLSCSGSSSEARLSFVALGDLLGDALQEVLPALPAPQAKGLAVALLVEEAEGSSQDQRAIALALVGALRLLARSQPVAVAIDDVQWLDRPSAFVLEFALRRLRGEAVAFLLTRRQEEGARCGRDSSRNIKANGPTIYAHEVYVLTGAARRASYTVTLLRRGPQLLRPGQRLPYRHRPAQDQSRG